jgi:hypothetical protein
MEIVMIIIKAIVVIVSVRPVLSSLVLAISVHALTVSSWATTSHAIIFADRFSDTYWHSLRRILLGLVLTKQRLFFNKVEQSLKKYEINLHCPWEAFA